MNTLKPVHGGNLHAAIATYGGEPAGWIDLSAALNPRPYPVPAVPSALWHTLPQPDAAFLAAACTYYGAANLLPVAGSQAAIQALPRLRPPGSVAVAHPSYGEHGWRWARHGHAVSRHAHADLGAQAGHVDVLILCNPDNPSGHAYPAASVLRWAQQQAARGGWLLVDEAFADVCPELSVTAHAGQLPGLIVLRSPGKFFGLAGLRLGFVAAEAAILQRLDEELGPWTIPGAVQHLATAALRDSPWQQQARANLAARRARLAALLAANALPHAGCDLFAGGEYAPAAALQRHLATQHIWCRLFTEPQPRFRLGLPAEEPHWQRLAAALAGFRDKDTTA
ncbi:threonine-phosphate decarboxylase CobD [Vogesella alkaliphila]|uniref:Putative 8-amino-7-oxononanoate synthase n=1 Tax=Vogesella alkaliphila TaxID=1193621 RepID=A0ABQ2YDB9_9NEIS|nr:threonine-phosphate decarboxylase CobD [Vogesella alkaliphila]GGX80660.1 threonine-phosphate decarboxylase [Vogesella alkaliphila]